MLGVMVVNGFAQGLNLNLEKGAEDIDGCSLAETLMRLLRIGVGWDRCYKTTELSVTSAFTTIAMKGLILGTPYGELRYCKTLYGVLRTVKYLKCGE